MAAANVRSLFILAKLVVPLMTAEGGGSIINISSGGADHAATAAMPPGFLAYSVAKAAMERFTTALAPEVAAHGIAVNALRPGRVKTELATRVYQRIGFQEVPGLTIYRVPLSS